MKKLVVCLMFSVIFSFTLLSANEREVIKKGDNESHSVSFAKAFKDGPTFGLVEKMSSGDSQGWARLSKGMFYLGVAGAVIAGVSLLLIVIGSILYGLWWGGVFGFNPGIWYLACVLIGIGAAFITIGLIMAVVGFVLWYVFGKNAGTAMYMENRQGIVSTNSQYQGSSPAVGFKFSF